MLSDTLSDVQMQLRKDADWMFRSSNQETYGYDDEYKRQVLKIIEDMDKLQLSLDLGLDEYTDLQYRQFRNDRPYDLAAMLDDSAYTEDWIRSI